MHHTSLYARANYCLSYQYNVVPASLLFYVFFSSNSNSFSKLNYYKYITDEAISPFSEVRHPLSMSMRAV